MSLFSVRAVVALGLIYSVAQASLAQDADPFGGPPDGVQVFDPFGDGDLIGGDDPFGGDPDALPPLPKVKEGAKPRADVVVRPAAAKADAEGEARIEAALDSKTRLEFIETALKDVADFIGDLHKIRVTIDEPALNDVGLGKNTPITRSLSGITLRSALRLMLKELDLTYVVRGGTLMITTPEEAESELITRIYPVGHLLKSTDPLVDQDDYTAFDLIDLVTYVTSPYTWEEVGGPGSVVGLRNSLIVSQTRPMHRNIAELLDNLDQARKIIEASKGQPPQVTSLPRRAAADGKIFKALSEDVACDFRETPLQDVVDFLVEQTKIEIQIDHRALEDVGIGSDTPINFKRKGISLRSALRLMLREMDLTFVVRDEVLLITTPEESEQELQTRVFPVADLVYPDDDDDWVTSSYGGTASGDYDSLIDLITATVRPTYWEEVGGPGAIKAWNGCLVFSQVDEVFDHVEALLAGIRKLKAEIGDDPRKVITEAIRLDEADSPKIAKLREALDGEVGMLAFKKTSLTDVMALISEKHSIPILIDARGMEDVGIDPNREVLTASLGGESVGEALRRLLRPFDLTFYLRDEVIMITNPFEAESELATRIYPVGDLVLGDGERDDIDDELIDAIVSTIRPTTWEEVGGPGAVEPYYPVLGLVISQTEQVHEEIADLLAQIRRIEAKDSKEVVDKEPAKPEVVKNKQGEVLHLKVYHLAKKEPEESQELAEVIRDLVEPESWKAGDNYYLRPMGGSIIVRQTTATHRKIDRLLRELDMLPWPRFGGSGYGQGIDNGQGFDQGGPGLGDGLGGGGGVFAVPDHIQGQFGGGGGLGMPAVSPIRAVRALSLPASEDRPAMPLRVYRLSYADAPALVDVIRELVRPENWKTPGVYLRVVDGKLLLRQTAAVHRRVNHLLVALEAFGPPRESDGFCTSVIPVVGERR